MFNLCMSCKKDNSFKTDSDTEKSNLLIKITI